MYNTSLMGLLNFSRKSKEKNKEDDEKKVSQSMDVDNVKEAIVVEEADVVDEKAEENVTTEEDENEADQEEIQVEAKEAKNPQGSKDKHVPKEENKQKKSNKAEISSEQPSVQEEVTFFGFPIRKFKIDGKLFFVVEDVLKTSTIPGAFEEYEKLKGNKEIAEKISQLVTQIPYVLSVEGDPIVNLEESGKGEPAGKIECAMGGDLIEIIGMTKKPFPGPISRWITEQS